MTDRRDAGFALLFVLWSLALLSLLLAHVLSAGRSEAQLAANLRDAARLEAIADGAVHDAIFHVVAGGAQHWLSRSGHRLSISGGSVEIRIENVADTINPNRASLSVLHAIMTLCGASAQQAGRIAQAVIDWRSSDDNADRPAANAYRAAGLGYAPPGQPLQTLDELGLIVGMTQPLLDCMTPHLSLYQEADPGPRSMDGFVRQALLLAGLEYTGASGEPDDAAQAVIITVTARLARGPQFTRQATVQLGSSIRILSWQ